MTVEDKGGRPKKFLTVEDMRVKIDHYFGSITKTQKVFETVVIGYKDTEKEKPITEKRPVLDNNGEQLLETIYFERPSILAMCRHLDIHRDTLLEYAKDDEFTDTIKKAKAKVEEYLEQQLYRKEQVVGMIFNLKNNFGWKDESKREIEVKMPSVILE